MYVFHIQLKLSLNKKNYNVLLITMKTTCPVGDGSEVGEVGICREFPRREPTVPTLSTAFSIKHPPDKTAHPPDEAAAVAAVVKDSLK